MPQFLRAIEFAICPRAGPMCIVDALFERLNNFRKSNLLERWESSISSIHGDLERFAIVKCLVGQQNGTRSQ
jgi:hypothetical protein